MVKLNLDLNDFINRPLLVVSDGENATERVILKALSGDVALVIYPERKDLKFEIDDIVHTTPAWAWVPIKMLTLLSIRLSADVRYG